MDNFWLSQLLLIGYLIALGYYVSFYFHTKFLELESQNQRYYETLRDFVDSEKKQYYELHKEIIKLRNELDSLIKK